MTLLKVELSRFFARRAIVLLLLAGVVVALVMVASAAYETRPMSQAETDAAQQALAGTRQDFEQDYQRCLADPAEFFGAPSAASDCEAQVPSIDWFLERSPLDLGSEVDGRGTALLVLLAGLAVVIGATFCGADWATGSMGNQLLFAPRRVRLWAAKAGAVLLGTAVGMVAPLALFWGGVAAVALSRGNGLPSGAWAEVVAVSARGIALAAVAAVGAYALTMLLRHTVGTLGLLFAYVVAGELLAATLPFEKMSQWSLSNNVLAWYRGGWRIFDESLCDHRCGSAEYVLGLGQAAAYLGVLVALAVGVSVLSFRSRDVP